MEITQHLELRKTMHAIRSTLKLWSSRFATNRFLASASHLAGAAVIGQLLILLAMPVLTRIYGPSDFGVFAAFSASMGLVLVVSSMRYEMAIPLMRNDRSARAMLICALGMNALTSVASLIAVLVWGDYFARLLKAPLLENYLILIPIAILGAGSHRALNLWVLRRNGYVLAAKTKLLQSVTTVLVQLAAGFGASGPLGLITGHIFGFTAGGLRLARGVAFNGHPIFSQSHRRRSIILLRGHGNFPRFDVPASLVDMLGLQLPSLALVALFGPAVAGTYFLAERMLTAPMGIVAQALAQSVLANARETNQQRQMVRQTINITIGLVVIMSAPVAVVVFGGEYLFSRIFDESWRQAGSFAAWLVLGFAIQFIYSSISTTLMATKGQKVNLLIHTMLLVFKIAALVIGYRVGDPMSSIIALSIANVVGGICAIIIVFVHISYSAKSDPPRKK